MAEVEKKPKIKSKEYPAVTLNQAIEFIKKLKEYPMGKPISYEIAAQTVGVSTGTKSFKYTISAAKQYGLISTSSGNTLSFLDPAKKILYPTGDDATVASLKMQCFSNPTLYAELIKGYQGKSLPQQGILENLLVSTYGIAPNAKKVAAKTFIDTANEVGAVHSGILCLDVIQQFDNTASTNNLDVKDVDDNYLEQISDNIVGMEKLVVPFGKQRQATVFIPSDITAEDAEYLYLMIFQMLKRLFKLQDRKQGDI